MLPRQPNQSIIDGIRCLQFVVTQPEPTGVTQLAAGLGLELTRVHRLLRTLTYLGLIVQTEGRKYGPGPAIPVLAAQTLHATGFNERALPELERLRSSLKKTVALGVLWERSVSYLYHRTEHTGWQKAIGGHDIWPATISGLGMAILAKLPADEVRARFEGHEVPGYESLDAMLAALDEIRSLGYAFVHTRGTRWTLAVALENNPSLAVGVTGLLKPTHIKSMLPQIQDAAAVIDAGFSLFRVR